MNTNEIVQRLRAERARLDAAIQALQGIGGAGSGKRRGRPPASVNKPVSTTRTKRRGMSAAARKRIAEFMRKRWAAAKKSGKKRL